MKVSAGVVSMSWNSDRSQVAVATNSSLIEIFEVRGTTFTKLHTLSEHDQLVSAVDWNGATNRILSASHDRNAYVWEFVGTRWLPNLVVLKNRRAILDAAWSLQGTKITIGTGGKKVAIGHYNPDINAWSTKLLSKVHNSAVTCVRFHPTGLFVASGGTDGVCNITSAYMEVVDGPQASARPLGEIVHKIDLNQQWVNGLAWSPDGNSLGVALHNATVTVFSIAEANRNTVTWSGRPFFAIEFSSNEKLIVGGWDYTPVEILKVQDRWLIGSKLDSENHDRRLKRGLSLVQAMKNKIEQVEDLTVASLHQGLITSIRTLGDGKVAIADVTGIVHIWEVA